MNWLKRLWLVFTYGPELEELLKTLRAEQRIREMKLARQHLDLCVKHQPRTPGLHYAETNCDHCKVLRKLSEVSHENQYQ